MSIPNKCEYLTVEEQCDMQVRREGSVVHLTALRSDGSVGASMTVSAERAPELIEALAAVLR